MTALRVCLYARYSTDKQRESSIVDQLRGARERAEREGWRVVATHADEGVSASTPIALRTGGKALLADALASRFDVLIVEGLDRLSREVGEAEQVVKRLEHRQVRIIGTADGYDTNSAGRKVMRIARGMVNELYLDDLREKTHRGLAGQFDRGFSAGGRSYGYRTEDAGGHGRRSVIDEAEAVHVRWVFARYAEGWSPASIVHDLNRRGIPAPRGGTWAVSAVYGSAARGLGLLNNELYGGRVIWNRRQWLKDPETGKRRYVDRPRSEWQERDAPELRIVDEDTWRAARARSSEQGLRGAGVAAAKRGGPPARTLFGGLLRCPTCGGPVIAVNSTRYGCGVHKDRGPAVCANSLTVGRELLDKRLVALVREDLASPAAVAELQRQVAAVLGERQRSGRAPAEALRRRLEALDAEIGRLVDAVVSIGHSDALARRLRTMEEERKVLLDQAETAAAPVPKLDNVVGRYKALLLDLQARLEREDDRGRTRDLLSQLLGPVTVVRDDDGTWWAEMQNPAEQLAAAGGISSLSVVAGAGFEPTTFGL